MKYAVEMCLDAVIYIPSFVKISSGTQKSIRRDTQAHRQHGDRIRVLEESGRETGPYMYPTHYVPRRIQQSKTARGRCTTRKRVPAPLVHQYRTAPCGGTRICYGKSE
jgi:hypothetical protein